MVRTGWADAFGSSAEAFTVNATTANNEICINFMWVPSVGRQVYAGEVSGHCGDVGIVQALCDRAHQLAGVVLSRAVLEGLERAREEFRRLSGQVRCGMRHPHAVRTVTAVACLNTLGFIALKRQLMAARQMHGHRRR